MGSHRGFPLRPTLISGVMTLIILAAGGTGLSAYSSSRRALGSLWRHLAGRVADSITERTLRYLEPAVPYVEMTDRLAREGRINPDDRRAILDYFKAAIDANPDFTWASYGDETGTYMAAYRVPGGAVHATWRDQLPAEKTTIWRDFEWADGKWKPQREKKEPYDPRGRHWYVAAAKSEKGVWGEPFLFTSRKQPGFIYSRRLMRDGKLHGVWAVQWEVKYLSDFLKTIQLGESGRVYVVTKGGLVVGHPEFEVLKTNPNGEQDILKAAEHPDPLLRGAWAAWNQRGRSERFAFDQYLGLADAFPAQSGIDWVVMGVVPVSDFFGEARRQLFIALIVSSVCLVLAVIFGAVLATGVSHSLREMAVEMDHIGHFELTDKKLAAQRGVVREVNVMGEAADRMKNSLRSFAKYVPTRLVGELMQSGREAVLGGVKKELTILFCDIAGFTTLSEKMEPEVLVAALAEYFAGASDAIAENGGTVDKFIGDAVMAFWGAPQDVADAPVKACRAALQIQARVHEMSARWQAQGRPAFDVRIGINTGVALVGNIGSQTRMNYTVMGDAVNLASRLEGLNKAYGTRVMVGEATAAQVGNAMLLRPLDWVAVKGKATAVLVHELLAEAPSADGKEKRAAALHWEALQLYRQRYFNAAEECFLQVGQALGGGDEASRVMAERCRRYLAEPPPSQWDGTMAMKEK
jgi:adenylate cyclase